MRRNSIGSNLVSANSCTLVLWINICNVGKLTLVPVSDKRPEVSVNTVNDEFQED